MLHLAGSFVLALAPLAQQGAVWTVGASGAATHTVWLDSSL